MAKKFDIHNWQAKHLFEQDDFTPDLEDDDLKRSKIQQMMAKEKDLQQSDYLSDVEPKIEGPQRAALEELADKLDIRGDSAYVRVSQLKKQAIDKLIENVDYSQVVDFL